MLIDLQTHSSYSDGYLKPADLALALSKEKIKVAVLTDHNTTAGLTEFSSACKDLNIKSLAGLELYVSFKRRKFNLLWYGFDYQNQDLNNLLLETQKRRRRQCQQVLRKLVRLGFKINIEKVLAKYPNYVPVNHLVDDLRLEKENRKKIIVDLKKDNPREEEIIAHYFYNKKVAELSNSYIDFHRVLNLRKKIGGFLVLCHPNKHGRLNLEFVSLLKKIGLDGIEVLSPHHSVSDVLYLQQVCRDLDLIETGGSDFHRFEGKKYHLQSPYQWFRAESDFLRGIKRIIK